MKNNSINRNFTTISKYMIFFSVVLVALFCATIYHAITYHQTDSIKEISSITTLPNLSLSVGIYEKRVPEYKNEETLYPNIEEIDYLGFVYAK